MALLMTLTEDEDPPIKEFSILNKFLSTKSQRTSLLAEVLFLVFADGEKRPLPWVEIGYIEHAPRLSDRAITRCLYYVTKIKSFIQTSSSSVYRR